MFHGRPLLAAMSYGSFQIVIGESPLRSRSLAGRASQGIGPFLFFIYLWVTPNLHAATKHQSAVVGESRKELVGTWEVVLPEKFATIHKAFIVLEGNGKFRILAFGEVDFMPVRATLAGTWGLQDQSIIATVTESPDLPETIGKSTTEQLLAVDATTITFKDEDATFQMHRSHLPDSLPPELNGPLILLTNVRELTVSAPRPYYPSEAVRLDLRGRGIFRLHADLRNGVVKKVEIEQSTGKPILDKAAVDAFQKWFFKAPLLRQLHRRRDPRNTTGEIVFRTSYTFTRSGVTRAIGR